MHFPMLQMIMRRLPEDAPVGPQPIDLSVRDTPSLMELAQIAKSGPFGSRTAELGAYVGIRDAGRLIAMVGERMRVPGYVELSAIATHPDARGRGLAGWLTYCLASRALGRGETPFLHVRPENAPALSVYGRLGFEIRREIWVLGRKPVSVAAP
jgi:predicted GNAT family acetyltransferase